MIGMQYKIVWPNNYDMGIIRDRVKNHAYQNILQEVSLMKASLLAFVCLTDCAFLTDNKR